MLGDEASPNEKARHNGRALSASTVRLRRRLPLRLDILGRLVQVNMLVDMVDQSQRNEMMLAAGSRIALGELDLVGALEVIDLADVGAVGTENFHVFLDVLSFDHFCTSLLYRANPRGRYLVPLKLQTN